MTSPFSQNLISENFKINFNKALSLLPFLVFEDGINNIYFFMETKKILIPCIIDCMVS